MGLDLVPGPNPETKDGELTHLTVGTHIDITERKRAEAAMARDEAQLSAIYDHAPLMMCLINERGEVERMNRAMAGLAEPPPKGVPRQPGDFLGCLHALDNAAGCGAGPQCGTCALRLAMKETFRTRRPQSRAETTLSLAPRGVRTELRVSVSTAFLQIAGEPKLLLCVEDITERKRLEAQLRQAQKLEAIGQLASGVAHDFNNMLAAILLHIGLLRSDPRLPAEIIEMFQELEDDARRATNLPRQLLLFSRRQAMQSKPLCLDELIQNILKLLRRLIGETIRIEFHPDAEPLQIFADHGMIEQLVMNLCINARDAMPEGGCLTLALELCEINEDHQRKVHDARAGQVGPFPRHGHRHRHG